MSLGFGAQGFVFAMLLTSLDVFKDRYGIDDGTITFVILGVCIMAGVGTFVADRIARSPAGAARSSSGADGRRDRRDHRLGGAVLRGAGGGIAVYGVGLGMVDSGTNMQAVTIQRLYGRSLLTGFYASWSAGGILGTVMVAVASGRVAVEPVGWTLPSARSSP